MVVNQLINNGTYCCQHAVWFCDIGRGGKTLQTMRHLFVKSCSFVIDGRMVNLSMVDVVPEDLIVPEAGYRNP